MSIDRQVRLWKDDTASSDSAWSPAGAIELDSSEFGGLRADPSHWFTPTIGCCNTADGPCDTRWFGGC